ncbi:Cys-tRNA(Pro) deacylase [Pseudomonas aeruginosa]|uniref:Cys-tRNA(Pro) deacylase n=1 Tax=Pseudomonas aeruginosa TaxID=287 RepID=UPI000FC40FD2|nr:Cys-tRNA(Pro) deacylase [Pseudomonas aeruginosa]EKX9354866.1 Cys-tRNA(Pro) deacylase [Pseudomonas aeruginosa]RUE01514.1 Cys-tRNA(Pro) deacylase [Pseudomonas aeruginosa]
MSKATQAMIALEKAGCAFEVLEYDYDATAKQLGMFAAAAVGVSPESVLKTLMLEADGKPICVVVPVDRTVSLKKVAKLVGAKNAQMMPPAKAQKQTGYTVGGISPFGQKSRARVFLDETAMFHSQVVINGGKRGVLIKVSPQEAQAVTSAQVADLLA